MPGCDVIGFIEATPGTGTVYLNGALGERYYTTVADDITLKKSEPLNLYQVLYGAISTPNRALLRAPSMRNVDFEDKKSVLLGSANPSPGILDLRKLRYKLPSGDKLNALSVNATDEYNLIALFLSSIPMDNLPAVDIDYIITGLSPTNQAAATWTLGATVWNQTLPAGTYVPVYMQVWAAGASMAVARLQLKKGDFHPGVPCSIMTAADTIAIASSDMDIYRLPLTKDHAFEHDAMPEIETLANAVNTDYSTVLGLKKIA